MAFYDSIPEAAKWLDVVEHDWYKKVDKNTLSMTDNRSCICGDVSRLMATIDKVIGE